MRPLKRSQWDMKSYGLVVAGGPLIYDTQKRHRRRISKLTCTVKLFTLSKWLFTLLHTKNSQFFAS